MGCINCSCADLCISSIIRGEETHIIVYCDNCQIYFPLNGNGKCTVVDAFCELVTSDMVDAPVEVLLINDVCITPSFKKCLLFQKQTCKRILFTQERLSKNNLNLFSLEDVITFKNKGGRQK